MSFIPRLTYRLLYTGAAEEVGSIPVAAPAATTVVSRGVLASSGSSVNRLSRNAKVNL